MELAGKGVPYAAGHSSETAFAGPETSFAEPETVSQDLIGEEQSFSPEIRAWGASEFGRQG